MCDEALQLIIQSVSFRGLLPICLPKAVHTRARRQCLMGFHDQHQSVNHIHNEPDATGSSWQQKAWEQPHHSANSSLHPCKVGQADLKVTLCPLILPKCPQAAGLLISTRVSVSH